MSEEDYEFYDHLLANNWTGLKALDEQFFPRMFGYTSKQDYYDSISVAEKALDIKVPTFCLDAADDQICGGNMYAPRKAAQSEQSRLCLASTSYGAHVCHLYGHIVPKPWYTKPCLEYFQFLEARNTFNKKED